jgi:ketosteroid isomerase-like protein
MSQENVKAFKRVADAGSRQDAEAFLAELDPEVEWHAVLPMVGGDAVYRGHEGVREFLREVWELLADTHFEDLGIRDLGARLLAIGRMCTGGKASGAATESPFCYLVQFKNGKANRVRAYLDPQEALEAAGLRE